MTQPPDPADANAPPPIDPGEAALAIIGITPIISGDMPYFGVEKTREAENFIKRIDEAAKGLAAGDVQKPKIGRPHSYRTLLDKLSRGLSLDEIHGLVAKFSPEASSISGPFIIAVQQAMDHLKTIFPTSEYVTFTGPTSMTPPEDKVFEFFLQYAVVDDPLSVFGLMSTASLLRGQVATVKAFYPTISANITASTEGAIVAEKAKKQSYQLRIPASDGFKTWLGQRTVDFQPMQPGRIVPQSRSLNPAALKPVADASKPQNPQEV